MSGALTRLPGKRYDFRQSRRWRKLVAFVLVRDGHRCHWCGGKATEGDHLVAAVRWSAGWFDPANVVASCRSCNARRQTGEEQVRSTVFQGGPSRTARISTLSTHEPGWAPIRVDYGRTQPRTADGGR